MSNNINGRGNGNVLNNQWDMTSGSTSAEVARCICEAEQARSQLADFMGQDVAETRFVSLGENCSSAWYLKQLGLKDGSYPFDWIFSSPEIVQDCINDGFEKYLDRELMVPIKGGTAAGHSLYHEKLFSHRSPLVGDEDYDYYQRCCNRFLELMALQASACYLITLINEPSKRVGWAKGFTGQFAMPEHQGVESVSDLVGCIKEKNANAKFVVVDHYTEGERHTVSEKVADDLFFIGFYAGGRSTGVFYPDKLDDFCFKLILTGLFGASGNQ